MKTLLWKLGLNNNPANPPQKGLFHWDGIHWAGRIEFENHRNTERYQKKEVGSTVIVLSSFPGKTNYQNLVWGLPFLKRLGRPLEETRSSASFATIFDWTETVCRIKQTSTLSPGTRAVGLGLPKSGRTLGGVLKKLPEKQHHNLLIHLVLLLIKLYRYVISPLLGPACRFEPTCSEYAYQAFSLHGFLRGSLLTIKRLLRCHPFNPGGYDPVP